MSKDQARSEDGRVAPPSPLEYFREFWEWGDAESPVEGAALFVEETLRTKRLTINRFSDPNNIEFRIGGFSAKVSREMLLELLQRIPPDDEVLDNDDEAWESAKSDMIIESTITFDPHNDVF